MTIPIMNCRDLNTYGSLSMEYTVPVLAADDVVQPLAEDRVASDAHLIQPELARYIQCCKPINDATPEIDARRFREVARRHGHLGDLEAESRRLRYHFAVEHEIVRVEQEGDRAQ